MTTSNESQPRTIEEALAAKPERKSKFTRQVFDVLMNDGTEYLDVTIIHADRVLGEMTANKHKWGDRPLYQVTFWVWAALRRTGQLPAGTKFEEFVKNVTELEKQDNESEADPTQEEGMFD